MGSPRRTERISHVTADIADKLREQLDELDELRGQLEEEVKSAVRMIPGLNEEKERLHTDITADRERIEEIDKLIPKLENQKAELEEDLQGKQERISEIEGRIEFLSRTKGIRS